MKKYNVLIEETCGRVITVMAHNEEEADEIVRLAYEEEKIVLNASDCNDVLIGGEYTEEAGRYDEVTEIPV